MRKGKNGENTQKCLIFRNRKSVKRRKPRKTGWKRVYKVPEQSTCKNKSEVYTDCYPKRHLIVCYGILINCFPQPQMKLVSSPVP